MLDNAQRRFASFEQNLITQPSGLCSSSAACMCDICTMMHMLDHTDPAPWQQRHPFIWQLLLFSSSCSAGRM